MKKTSVLLTTHTYDLCPLNCLGVTEKDPDANYELIACKGNNRIKIISEKNLKNASVFIYDINGRLLKRSENMIGKRGEVDLDGFSNGIYFVMIKGNEALFKKKILINN